VQGFSFLVMLLKESKTVFVFRQTQQYLYISFYYDNMFRSTDHYRAIYTNLLCFKFCNHTVLNPTLNGVAICPSSPNSAVPVPFNP